MKTGKEESRNMREEVYDYLHEYGFSAIDIDKIEKENEDMFYTDISEVRKNITFLEEKYLESEDIINIINDNPFMLTEKNNRLEALDDIYNGILSFDYESLKTLIKNNPEAYTVSPIELNKIINHMKEIGYSIDIIKQFILKNSKVISMSYDTFLKVIKS